MKRLLYLLLCFFIVGNTTAEAQFLKKLRKSMEKKIENTMVDNVSDKAADETEKTLNNLWEKQLNDSSGSMGMETVDHAAIPSKYAFDWEYTLDLKTSQANQEMVYLIKDGAPYLGINIPNADNMLTILDHENKMTIIFFDTDEGKMLMATKNPSPEGLNSDNHYEDTELEKIGKKAILGYDCQGYRFENRDHLYEFYITDEAGLSFKDLYRENQKNVPKGWNTDWLKDGEGLMMEMTMKDKKNAENNITMTCVGIERKPFTITTSDYKSMNMDEK